MSKALTYVEIDVDSCTLTYGTAPCTAAIPTTGSFKCFNSLGTCQDRTHFTKAVTTYRFGIDTGYLPTDIECFPSLKSVSINPSTISLGQGLGVRATVTATFKDHKHNDTGVGADKYASTRSYDPYNQGTFFGKFRVRNPYLRGRSMRVYRGFVGQTLAQMECRYYIVEAFDGPSVDGTYTIVGKDVLKLADDDRSQAPNLTQAYLSADITSGATTLTLNPAGAGNAFFAASGSAAIGGKEIVTYTRVGDVLTITRAQNNTDAVAHKADDRVQVVLIYTAQTPAAIIADLMINYAKIPSAYIDQTAWALECTTYLQRVYSAVIADPVGVNALISELCEQAALAIWWDDVTQRIRLQVLKAVSTGAYTYDENIILEKTLGIKDQNASRISEVWTYFGQRNPLEKIDDPKNYRSALATVDLQAETDYGTSAVKTIFSRWIPQFGRSIASRLNDLVISRYRDPPRRFNFSLMRSNDGGINLGDGYKMMHWSIQDSQGAQTSAPFQVTRLNPMTDRIEVEGEEMLFKGVTLDNPNVHTITIDSNTNNFNLRTVHDSLFGAPTVGLTINLIINAGITVGSTNQASPSLDIGSWINSPTITVTNNGTIQGAGGYGSFPPFLNGQQGGRAMYTRYAIALTNSATGKIWGGGGGGGGSYRAGSIGDASGGGGGGAGTLPGAKGSEQGQSIAPSTAGTANAGGMGGSADTVAVTSRQFGGAGGGPGSAGSSGSGTGGTLYAAGAAGNWVDGLSFVTLTNTGSVLGTGIN